VASPRLDQSVDVSIISFFILPSTSLSPFVSVSFYSFAMKVSVLLVLMAMFLVSFCVMTKGDDQFSFDGMMIPPGSVMDANGTIYISKSLFSDVPGLNTTVPGTQLFTVVDAEQQEHSVCLVY
jgi:hypothetical protein